jgi:3-hydroxyisobutyrate dehydrogenase-like beta-hydroxyacid dehydrogenase
MVAEDFAPRFTASLIAKDLRYAVADAAALEAGALAVKTSAPPSRPITADAGRTRAAVGARISDF